MRAIELLEAAETGDVEAVRAALRALLDRGADVAAIDQTGQTPLHAMARADRPEHVALLLDRGAELDARDRNQRTPLHAAAQGGASACCHLRVQRGADVEARDVDDETPTQMFARGPEARG